MPLSPLTLLADRDGDTRLMYGEFLRRVPFQIDEAEDGHEAIAKAVAHQPSVIVTETRLPGLSGLELCRLLRGNPETAAIPIVILTGDALEHERRLAEAAGADAVLIKPCFPMRLAAELARVLASRNAFANVHAGGRAAHGSGATVTTSPPKGSAACPGCTHPLRYLETHTGHAGDRYQEQWDYFACDSCRMQFEHRRRTRTLRECLTGVPGYRLPQSSSK